METQAQERIRKVSSKNALTVGRVYTSDFQKEGTETAELRQSVTTKSYYPSKSVSNNLQDNIFGQSDFGFEEQEFENEEKRVSWINVPVGSTVETVSAKLASFPNATLYRFLSNHPVLTDDQVYGINAGLTTKETIAESQIVRYPMGSENEGQIATDSNGKPQYRQIFFSATAKEDIDKRTSEPSDYYASPAIMDELADVTEGHVVEGQQLPS